jgi:hypothetical protein
MNDPIQLGMLIVQVIGLLGLFWYAWETRAMRKASQEQVNISQALISAAMDQVEGLSKPCLALCGELRDPSDVIWASSTRRNIGSMIVRKVDGKFVVENIGNGVALNVEYSSRQINPPDNRLVPRLAGYLQNVLSGSNVKMAEPVTPFEQGEYEIIFLFQSIGGRQYRTTVTMNDRVLTKFEFKEVSKRICET